MAQADIPTLVGLFVALYNNTYDTNRGAISQFYHPQAMLTFESENHVGAEAIQGKLGSLPFQEIRHDDKPTVRVQPSVTDGFVLVMITGHFSASGLDKPFAYSQTFQLKVPDVIDPNLSPEQNAAKFQICNDFFLLSFG